MAAAVDNEAEPTAATNVNFRKQKPVRDVTHENMEKSEPDNGSATPAEDGETSFKVTDTFNSHEIERLCESVLIEKLADVTYDPRSCKQLSQSLAALMMERIKALHLRRYKLVAVVSLGSLKDRRGMQFGSRCLWNQDTDAFASVKFTNGSLFAVALVYGMLYG